MAVGTNVYIKAESNGSAAPLYKIAKFDPKEYYPQIAWNCKNDCP